jgi:hypothetical protein
MTQTAEVSIESQRAALEGRLAELQQLDEPAELAVKAQEALDRKYAAIAEVQRQIDEVDAATDARTKHRRAEAEQRRLDQREALRQQMVEHYEVFLKAVGEAESHAQQLADNFRAAYEALQAIARAASKLSGEKSLNGLSVNDLVRRLSQRLSGTMKARLHKDHRLRFGAHTWQGADYFPADQAWAAAEERAIAPVIIPLLEKKGI